MAEPSVIVGTALATGLTLFGVSTGLDPAVLIAGVAGGLWAQSYNQPSSIWRRLALVALASLLSGYLAPALSMMAAASETVNNIIPFHALKLPVSVLVGLTSHRVLGPAFMKFASKKVEEYSK